ncbi:hypothetical protein IWQ60_009656 [Tieghemiomyces parasiticus]|uniref:RGS domain-containing protein n=1 Tax=Tieghemiomyces parasiticus TaxID=78921 RepID=A0A9W7ZTZ3_9FUNG|nr:hypothetical protein IWQ60_009656 [Tieghemiomyces parasiticus]
MAYATYEVTMEQLAAAGITPELNTRKVVYIVVAFVYAIYSIYTSALFYVRSKRNDYLTKRAVNLVMIQSIANLPCVIILILYSGLQLFPCFLVMWTYYLTFIVWGVVLILRSMILIYQKQMNEVQFALHQHHNYQHSILSDRTYTDSDLGEHSRSRLAGLRIRLQTIRSRRVQFHDTIIRRAILAGLSLAVIIAVVVQAVSPRMTLSPLMVFCGVPMWEFMPYYVWQFFFTCIISPILLYLMYGFRDAFGIRYELVFSMTVAFIFLPLYMIWFFAMPASVNAAFPVTLWPAASLAVCHFVTVVVPLILSRRFLMFQRELIGPQQDTRWQQFSDMLNQPDTFAEFTESAAACFCPELVIFLQRYQHLKVHVIRYYETILRQDRDNDSDSALPSDMGPLTGVKGESYLDGTQQLSVTDDGATLPASPQRKVSQNTVVGDGFTDPLRCPLPPTDGEAESKTESPHQHLSPISIDDADRDHPGALNCDVPMTPRTVEQMDAKEFQFEGELVRMTDTVMEALRSRASLRDLFHNYGGELPGLSIPIQREIHNIYTAFVPANAELAINLKFISAHMLSAAIENKEYSLTMYDEAFREALNMLYFNVFPKHLHM